MPQIALSFVLKYFKILFILCGHKLFLFYLLSIFKYLLCLKEAGFLPNFSLYFVFTQDCI